MKKTLKKPKGAIKNEQSRDTENTVHMTQNEDKQSKRHNIEIYKDEQHGPHQQTGDEPRCSRWVSISCFYWNTLRVTHSPVKRWIWISKITDMIMSSMNLHSIRFILSLNVEDGSNIVVSECKLLWVSYDRYHIYGVSMQLVHACRSWLIFVSLTERGMTYWI